MSEDGVPIEYHITFWKSEMIDFVILQQDAFDKIDSVCPLDRQEYMLNLVMEMCEKEYGFDTFIEVSDYFKRIINLCKQMNYCEFHSDAFEKYRESLTEILAERVK